MPHKGMLISQSYLEVCEEENTQAKVELRPSKKEGIVSLVFGILALITFNLLFALISLLVSRKSHKTMGYKLGRIAKIISIISIFSTIILGTSLVIVLLMYVIPTVLSWYGIFW